MIAMTDKEFDTLTKFVKQNYGIDLTKKRILIEGRLSNTITAKGLSSFEEYLNLIFNDKSGQEMKVLLNKLTTNHTFFLRESDHFQFLKEYVLPYLVKHRKNKDLRIWSAGCSAGQEPYTMAMVIADFFGNQSSSWDTTILATDLSTHVLEQAKTGIYSAESIKDVPPEWMQKYFIDKKDGTFEICDRIKKEVVFRHANLMEPFNYKKPFDIIFCRNVMIYYDAPTKITLVNKFYDCTANGGFLFIGHSETINRENTKYRYIKPAVYQKGENAR
ncbi:chemotaxis protein methyltransferase CheR [Hydrogenoanaerobacterium saccharovorans]|uniref:protein-glutamate O-methyltransferase n=1 Tax=Hydrogenoanaerobacterium saccharovorans TaxID=474960 RepID=A0A1H7ZCF7_9FIRM|nr:protein-glutamate O-methyltransferase CheR [Hydrogenoanaerobacterium saccharovorans]RPF48731.1 chemotaxis protein methyltransferase CheR [Hydrogenoanaerobacterium saccharovorans]SEM55238.1 chemotaxis protein methyltransferase CheR [Hydrogenoanaerobacterium saccharovorans]